MDKNIGVGAIVGLAFASSVYVWNSNSFTKEQKTGLLICIIFPPAQWLGILIVLGYNSYRESNSAEKVAERKINETKTKLDSSISNLTELKEKGILTDEEFKAKVEKIEAEKVEQNLKNSTEYRQLKSLFDSGILTQDEFENKIQLLQNVSEKEVDVPKISEIVNSATEIYSEPTEENKKDNNIIIYVGLLLLLVLVIFIFAPKNYETDFIDNNSVSPSVDTTSYNESNFNKESLNDEMNNSTEREIEKTQSISLFSDVSGIYPGETSLNEVKLILGEPDFIDITKTEFDENTGKFLGGNKIAKYKSLGIELLFEREDTHMSAVDHVLVKENFNAKSAEGIYIGMPEDECRNILDSKYFKDYESDDYKSYSKKEGGISGLSVWFKDGKLDALAIH